MIWFSCVSFVMIFASSTIQHCNIQVKEPIIGTDYFYISLYPFSYDEKLYQEIRNESATPTKPLGLLEYFVCNDIEQMQKIVLTLLLDKRFIQKNGKSNIYIIESHLPQYMTLQVASMVLPFQLTVRIMSKGEDTIDPKRYPNINQLLVNTYSEQVISIIKAFNLNNIAFIALTHNERDTAYKSVWDDLLQKYLGLCVERYNVDYEDTNRMKEVIEAIKSKEEQKIILCYTSTGENKNKFFKLVNISHQLGLSGRNWIWNYYYPSVGTLYNVAVGASDGAIVLRGGVNRGYDISNTAYILELSSAYAFAADMLLSVLPFSALKSSLKKDQRGFNCFYHNTSTGKSSAFKINERLYRTCERFDITNYPLKVHWGSQLSGPPKTQCPKRHCPAGYRPILTILFDKKENGRKFWKCIPCEKGSIKTKYGSGKCTKCSGLLVSNIERTQCYDPYRNIYFSYNSTQGIAVSTFSAVGAVLNVIIAYTFYKYRTTPIIKSANTRLSAIQQGCHLILFLITPVVFVGEPILIKCQTRHIFVGLFLTIVCSLIFIRTQKLMFIFNSHLRVSKQERYVATLIDLFWALLFVSVQVIIAMFTLSYSPAIVLESLDQKTLVRNLYCNTGVHLNLQHLCCVIIMLIVVVQGLRAWKLPSFFNDTKYITMANLLSILMSACMIPLYYSATNPITQVFLQVVLILSCNITLLIVMYGNKVYTVCFKSEKNTSAAFRKKMQEHAKEKINSSINERERNLNLQ